MKVVTNNTLSYFWSKIKALLSGKQDTLVSGTNIKTLNGQSLLGSGNVAIQIPPAPPEPLLVYMTESGGTYSLDKEVFDIEDALSDNDELECYLVWDGNNPAVVRLRCYGYNVEETIGGHSQSCIVWSGLDNIGNRHIVKAYHDSTNDVDVVNYSVASPDGKGITSIVKTATVGLVDTYTITYSDGTTSTYTVTNGRDGQDGQDGQDGADGVDLGEVALVQTTGDATDKVMSQKAITDAINYNINIEHGEGFTPNSNTNLIYLKLTTKATSLLNASDKMTFMFSTKGTGGNQDYRYFQFGNAKVSTNNQMDYNGACLVWSYSRNLSANAVSYTLNKSGSNTPTPDVWIVTWDRINGVVRFYDHTTLVNTLEGDSYKKDRFVNDDGIMALRGGDNNARIYDIRLFDFDLSYLFGYSDVSNEINYLCGAGILPSQFLDNYKTANADNSFFEEVNGFAGGGYNTCTYSLDGDDYHIIVKDSTTTSQTCGGKPYYIGRGNRAQIAKLNIEVVSGVIKLVWRNNVQNEFTNMHILLDENGDEISDYNNIGVGKYTYIMTYAATGASFNFYKVSGDVEIIINRNIQYKPISCVFHLRGDTMYNMKFYDDQTKEFITLYSNRTCLTEYTTHTMIKTPQRVIRSDISNANGLPHYIGEMAVVGNKVYVGMADYTWKQINNS